MHRGRDPLPQQDREAMLFEDVLGHALRTKATQRQHTERAEASKPTKSSPSSFRFSPDWDQEEFPSEIQQRTRERFEGTRLEVGGTTHTNILMVGERSGNSPVGFRICQKTRFTELL